MNEYQFTVVIEPDEQGYHAYVPVFITRLTIPATA